MTDLSSNSLVNHTISGYNHNYGYQSSVNNNQTSVEIPHHSSNSGSLAKFNDHSMQQSQSQYNPEPTPPSRSYHRNPDFINEEGRQTDFLPNGEYVPTYNQVNSPGPATVNSCPYDPNGFFHPYSKYDQHMPNFQGSPSCNGNSNSPGFPSSRNDSRSTPGEQKDGSHESHHQGCGNFNKSNGKEQFHVQIASQDYNQNPPLRNNYDYENNMGYNNKREDPQNKCLPNCNGCVNYSTNQSEYMSPGQIANEQLHLGSIPSCYDCSNFSNSDCQESTANAERNQKVALPQTYHCNFGVSNNGYSSHEQPRQEFVASPNYNHNPNFGQSSGYEKLANSEHHHGLAPTHSCNQETDLMPPNQHLNTGVQNCVLVQSHEYADNRHFQSSGVCENSTNLKCLQGTPLSQVYDPDTNAPNCQHPEPGKHIQKSTASINNMKNQQKNIYPNIVNEITTTDKPAQRNTPTHGGHQACNICRNQCVNYEEQFQTLAASSNNDHNHRSLSPSSINQNTQALNWRVDEHSAYGDCVHNRTSVPTYSTQNFNISDKKYPEKFENTHISAPSTSKEPNHIIKNDCCEHLANHERKHAPVSSNNCYQDTYNNINGHSNQVDYIPRFEEAQSYNHNQFLPENNIYENRTNGDPHQRSAPTNSYPQDAHYCAGAHIKPGEHTSRLEATFINNKASDVSQICKNTYANNRELNLTPNKPHCQCFSCNNIHQCKSNFIKKSAPTPAIPNQNYHFSHNGGCGHATINECNRGPQTALKLHHGCQIYNNSYSNVTEHTQKSEEPPTNYQSVNVSSSADQKSATIEKPIPDHASSGSYNQGTHTCICCNGYCGNLEFIPVQPPPYQANQRFASHDPDNRGLPSNRQQHVNSEPSGNSHGSCNERAIIVEHNREPVALVDRHQERTGSNNGYENQEASQPRLDFQSSHAYPANLSINTEFGYSNKSENKQPMEPQAYYNKNLELSGISNDGFDVPNKGENLPEVPSPPNNPNYRPPQNFLNKGSNGHDAKNEGRNLPTAPAQAIVLEPTQKRYHHYNSWQSKCTGTILIITGAVLTGLDATITGTSQITSFQGFWTGFLLILAGSFGVCAATSKSRCKVIAFMVWAILAACSCLVCFILSAAAANSINTYFGMYASPVRGVPGSCRLVTGSSMNCETLKNFTMALHIVMILVAVFAGTISIQGSVVGCKAMGGRQAALKTTTAPGKEEEGKKY